MKTEALKKEIHDLEEMIKMKAEPLKCELQFIKFLKMTKLGSVSVQSVIEPPDYSLLPPGMEPAKRAFFEKHLQDALQNALGEHGDISVFSPKDSFFVVAFYTNNKGRKNDGKNRLSRKL